MPLSRGTVLVVDDHLGLRDAMVEYLEEVGFICLAASSVLEARALLARASPEVLLVDQHLPDTPGSELVEWALQEATAPMQAFVMTGDGTARPPRSTVRMLIKPVDLSNLVRELDSAVARTRLA
jgi:DNA-binding NtrC family response regulator